MNKEVMPAQSPPKCRGVREESRADVVYDVQKVKLMMILLASKALSISQLVFGKKAVGSPLIAKISVAIFMI